MDAWKLIPADLEGYDSVVFLAGLANDAMCEFSPRQNFIANAALPSYLAYISKQVGVPHFISASSCSVYGNTKGMEVSETDSPEPVDPYGVAKLQAEVALLRLAADKFHVYCLRKGTVCGWSGRPRLDLLLNTMVRDGLLRHCISVRGPGIWRPILSVKDAVAVYSFLMSDDAHGIPSGVYNVAMGNYTVESLARTVADLFRRGNRQIRIHTEEAESSRNYRANLSKSKELLSLRAQQGPEEIVAEMYDHMADWNPACFADARFYNFEVFKKLMAASAKAA
jgi:nucleoside-diphosphate-sugar epimerase